MYEPHILIAEDDEALLSSICFILEDQGYFISKALDGRKALDAISKSQDSSNPVDLLITDIQMPDLNGLQLIRRVREIDDSLPVIVMTGYGDKETLKKLIKIGCDEFLDKPFEPDDLSKLVTNVLEKQEIIRKRFENRITGYKNNSEDLSQELETYKKSLDELRKELDNAVLTYKDLIHIPEHGFQVSTAWRTRPLHRLGGDFFSIANTDSGCDILIADVAGHDMSASYHTVLLKSFFDENCRTGKNGANFFRLLNCALMENKRNNRIITSVFLRIDLNKMKVEAVSAGHPDLIKTQKNSLTSETVKSDGFVLGLDKNASYKITKFDISSKDRLFLFTDGIINAKYTDGPTGMNFQLSRPGLSKLIEGHNNLELDNTIDSIWDDILKFCRYKPVDDMLLIGIEIP